MPSNKKGRRRHAKTKRHTRKRHTRKRHTRRVMRGGYNPFLNMKPYDAGAEFPNGTYVPLSKIGIPSGVPIPQPSNSLFGGGNKSKHMRKIKGKRKQRGGSISTFLSSILPDEITNFGRVVPSTAGQFMDKLNGVNSSPSSQVYPTQQPLVAMPNTRSTISPPNITSIYNRSNDSVAAL